MTEMDEMECDDDNQQHTETCELTSPVQPHVTEEVTEVVGTADDDLEEGECSSEEEAPAPVEEVKERKKSDKKSHRRTRSRSRERHKRSKRDRERERKEKELDADEKKKRDVLRKLKALEANMGIDYSLEEEEEEEAETPAITEESDSASSESRSMSRSPSRSPTKMRDKRKREREDRHGRKKRRNERRNEESEICGLFMQGKCQKGGQDCMFSHDADPPQVWELCKFYLNDRCAKRDKCLYLHKGFPCKFFHTGRQCKDTRETCKFSHEPLNDTTRTLLLKHIETAPKEILGEFPRMSRNEAATSIFQTEAKNKGWSTEGPDAVQPPVLREENEHKMEREDDQVFAPSHIKLDPIQEKLLKESQGPAGRGQAGRWVPNTDGPPGPPGSGGGPPLAVQQAMAMVGGAGGGGPMPGPQSHGVRNNGAFNQPGGNTRRQTVGLLGACPDLNNPWSGSPFGAGGGHFNNKGPQSLMDVRVNEEEVESYLIKQRIEAAKVHEDFNEESDTETPDVTPPASREDREDSHSPAAEIKLPKLPQNHLKFMKQRIQQKQLERLSGEDGGEAGEPGDSGDSGIGAPFSMNNLNLPTGLSNVLAAINQGSSPEQPARGGERREGRDPRRREKMSQRETEEELEKEKEQRILDLDLGSFFGDLELPPLTVSPERTEEEKNVKDAFGLPFKPHIIHEVAKEIDASFGSHSPIDWLLKPVVCPKPDYADIKHLFSNTQLEADPRLRKFAKSGMAKLKELPLPSLPPPKSDPRLNKKDPRQASRPPVVDRRRSSEDSDGGQVYNPAKELNKAKQQQQQQTEDHHMQQQQQQQQQQPAQGESEAYSPGQEYYGEPEPDYSPDQDQGPGHHYSPGYEEEADYEAGRYKQYDFPPHNFPPPPRGPPSGWGPPPPRGFPPRGPHMDPYFRGQGAPYRGHFGPPRGNFGGHGPIRNNGPPGGPRRGHFNRGGGGGDFHPGNRPAGGFQRNDPRKRE